jgi:elongation factor 2
MAGDWPKYGDMLKRLNMELSEDEEQLQEERLLTAGYRRWLPVVDAVMEMMIRHLPSPSVTQRYRSETLYTGRFDDECAQAIRDCDLNGPLMLYVAEIVPTADRGRVFAFVRVFLGTVAAGQRVRVMGRMTCPGRMTTSI